MYSIYHGRGGEGRGGRGEGLCPGLCPAKWIIFFFFFFFSFLFFSFLDLPFVGAQYIRQAIRYDTFNSNSFMASYIHKLEVGTVGKVR